MVTQGHRITSADFTRLFDLANGKALAGDYGTRGKWLAELNRLRVDVFNKITVRTAFGDGVWPLKDSADNVVSSADDPKNPPLNFTFAKVSGPWPLTGPNPFSGKQDFYYPDTGDTEEAKMSRWLYASWGSFGDDEYRNYYVVNKNFINLAGAPSPFITIPQTEGRFSIGVMKSKRKFAIVISGSAKVHCHGVIIIQVSYLQKGYTQNAGSQPVYNTDNIFDLIDVASTVPVPVEKIKDYRPLDDDEANPYPHFTGARFSALVWRLKGAYDPGRYEITLTVPDQGDDQSNFHYTLQGDGTGWTEVQNYTDTVVKSRADIASSQIIWNGRYEQPSVEAVEVSGIHDTKAVKCISLTPIWPAICSVKDSPEVVTMFPAPITASTDGYWLGKTYPIGNCFVPALNLTSPVRWPANAVVPVGCQIYDATGNIWTCIQAGNTASRELVAYYERGVYYWPHTLGAIYEEIEFVSGLNPSNPAKWQLTNLVRTRYETPWLSGTETSPGSQDFIRKVGEICVSRAGDFYHCTKTQTLIDGVWENSDTALDGLQSTNINVVADEPLWDRVIGNTVRLENFATVVGYAVEWTSIFHPGPTVNPGPARVGSQMFSYPCIWDEDGWIADALFNLGRKILEGGRIWVCSNGGQTGATKPDFSGVTEVADGTAKWQLESKVNYFSSESDSRYPLAAAASSGRPQKWWIRQLYLNRVVHDSPIWSAGATAGSVGGGFPNASTQSIPVEIGFYRSGAFVSLGHYMTGMQPMVMWPVFTDTPLVYKAGERVDVQASVVRPDFAFTYNHQLGFPISSEHYNDLERSLNLL